MSYGGTLTESFRWVGVYTGRILKGEPLTNCCPAVHKNRAVHQSNDRRALGLELPATLLYRADDIIE